MGALIAQLQALGRLRLAALGGLAVVLLAGLGFLVLRAGTPPMALLYGELEARDAGAVVAALERQRVPFRLAAGGSQVLVPAEDVPRLRLMLAREGLPAGGSLGYEIFDRGEGLTTTPFQQEMNRLRALEGELSRSIRALAGVRAARVHLVLPRREAFSRERGEAQASVLLTMQGAQRLDREGVQAVLHLVVAAVPGLRPANVSIVDSRGELLARGGQAVGGAAGMATREELRRGEEARLARAVEEMLERVLGPGRVRAEVALEMDHDRVETREERFDPDNQVARSQHSVTETSRSQEPQNVSVQNNLPGAEAGAGAGTQESRQEETTNFEIGRTVRSILREQPVLRRLSVGVLVDGVMERREGQPPQFRERTAEELARIAALVRSAVGFNEQRGDRVEVVSMRFAEAEAAQPEAPGLFGLGLSEALVARLAETALIGLLALLALFLIARPVARRLSLSLAPAGALAGAGAAGGAIAGAAAGGQGGGLPPGAAGAALPGGEGAGALPGPEGGEAMVSMASVRGQMRASSIAKLVKLTEEHPEEALLVLRRWLTPEDDA